MSELDPRKRIILKAVIVEYVAEGEPVGSELIATKYDLGVRGATVRNELAEMSEMGLLEQPHTSAGRIPSDSGYRYFVDHMVNPGAPEEGEQSRIDQTTQKAEILRDLLQDTTKLLSRMTHQLSAAKLSTVSKQVIRNAVVTALGERSALLVVVLGNGDVANRPLEIPKEVTLADFGELNDWLTRVVVNQTLGEVNKLKSSSIGRPGAIEELAANTIAGLKAINKDRSSGQLFVEGEEYVLAAPEVQRDAMNLSNVLQSIEDDTLLAQAIDNQSSEPLYITIGKENLTPGLHSLSILRHSFTIGDEHAGTIALVGPTRTEYEKNIALLKFTSKAISDSIEKLLR